MKRLIDILVSLVGLLALSPVLCIFILLIWLHDGSTPFYVALRVGKKGKLFNMVKLRSMTTRADSSGVDSTSDNDPRITSIGRVIRKYKLDEVMQFWNVLIGDMSLVGPRPNVQRETAMYTSDELHLLDVQPGITDFSSIVFSDEGKILRDYADPDLAYNQLIRPIKSRLGLFYISTQSLSSDLCLLFITFVSFFSRHLALRLNVDLLRILGANPELLVASSRRYPLVPTPPPGLQTIVSTRIC